MHKKAAFYHYIYKYMDAILASTELAYKFPETEQELNEAAQSFAALSSHGAIKGCVACLDGYLLQIKVPAKVETGNVKAYFSGHYQTSGINVHATCDHQCRFKFSKLSSALTILAQPSLIQKLCNLVMYIKFLHNS